MQSDGFLLKRSPVRRCFSSCFLPSVFCFLFLTGCGFFAKKGDPTEAANAFFALLREGKLQAAYESTAFTFQAQQSTQDFVAAVKELDLTDVPVVTWKATTVKEKETTLRGEIATKAGQHFPILVTLVEESGKWKLASLLTPKDGSTPTFNRFSIVGRGPEFANSAKKTAPPENEIKALVASAMSQIGEAMRKNSYNALFDSLATKSKAAISPFRLQRNFKALADNGVRLDGSENVEPQFDTPPALDAANNLMVSGTYPTLPQRVYFSLTFVYEVPRWKLASVDLKPLPSEAAMHAMAHDTLLRLNDALQKKNFAEFYVNISTAWHSQVTEADIQKAFQPFIDAGADFAVIRQFAAVWDAPPRVNPDGILIISGSYPTQPNVSFVMRFIYEVPDWKLFGLDVNIDK